MGQQQLLLLVLSTVIVGLATVAGIQAFSENQAQAAQDALVQRGTSISSDVQGAYGRPSQMGGFDNFNSTDGKDIADALGYDYSTVNTSEAEVSADGAGSSGTCAISATDDGSNGRVLITCSADDANQDVTVGFDPDEGTQVQTDFKSSGTGSPFST
jgi:hypothetical protein